MGRAALASGKLGQHNGLPATIIVSTTLKELESGAGQAVTAGGSLLPISDVIRMASHAFHYLVIFKDHKREPLYLGRTKRSPREANASSCTHVTAAVPFPAARCPATAAKRTTPSEVGLKVAKPTSTKKSSLAHPTTGSSKRAAGLPEYAPTAGSNGSRRHSWTTGRPGSTTTTTPRTTCCPTTTTEALSQSMASGSRTSNRAPVSRLRADSVPRCACTSPAAMARPSPEPLGSDASVLGTRSFDPR